MKPFWPDHLIEVDFAQWSAVSPAQRFTRANSVDGEATHDVLLIMPDEIYHSPEFQADLLESLKNHIGDQL